MRAMPLAFPGNPLLRALRDAVHVRRRAARRADRRAPAARSRSRCRPAHWFDLNTRQRIAGPAGAALPRQARPVSGVRARRLRAAARARGAAHGRDRRRAAARAAVGVRQADGAARRLRAGAHRRRATDGYAIRVAHRREDRGVGRRGQRRRGRRSTRHDAREARARDHVRRAGGHRPRAVRDARDAPCAKRRSLRASSCSAITRCSPSARRASASRRATPPTIPSRSRPAGGVVEIWHQPLAAPVTPGQPDPDERAQRAHDARARHRRLRHRRVRRAGHRAGAEERDDGRGHSVLRSHRVSGRAHAHAARRDAAGRRRARGAVARRARHDAPAVEGCAARA